MDRIDCKILQVLQKEGRLSNSDLAKKIGLSPPACWKRVKALEEDGVISGYTAIVERKLAGFGLCVFLYVSLIRPARDEVTKFEQVIKNRTEVQECYATTGEEDFVLRVIAKDIEAYDQFLEDILFELPMIAKVNSRIALREIKFDTRLPLES